MTEYRLGRSIAQILPFHRHKIPKEFVTSKLLIITMAIVAIAKIVVLIT